MTIKIEGELEVDAERGVLYFHSLTRGMTTLRICGLKNVLFGFDEGTQLDITHQADPVMVSKMFNGRQK